MNKCQITFNDPKAAENCPCDDCVKVRKQKRDTDVEKLAEDLMIYINVEAQRVAKTLNLDDYGKDLLHENMDMAYNEWKRKNLAGYNAAKQTK